jgi:predicted dienelactone hydrolase
MKRLLPLLLAATLAAAACGSDGAGEDTSATTDATSESSDAPVSPTTEAAPTTEPPDTVPETTKAPEPEVTAAELAARGPYAVGVTTRTLPEGGLVEIWYPADGSAAGGTVSYRVRDFLPPGVGDLITADIDDSFTIEATRDAVAAADGPFPIVLYSHGAIGFRLQASHIAEHLASWGIVTASTDHPSRNLSSTLAGTREGQPIATDEIRSMRVHLTTLADDPILGAVLDNDRVAVGGISAGGATAAEVAVDDGILGYVNYASGLSDTVADVPSLFMAGELDQIAAPSRTQEAFERAAAPSWFWLFEGTGHGGFNDSCAIGPEDSNLIKLADQAGLGDFIDDRLRTLATDGCEAPNRPVQEVWPGINQAATGFYRWVFGIDAEPVGLDESVVTDGVTITSK